MQLCLCEKDSGPLNVVTGFVVDFKGKIRGGMKGLERNFQANCFLIFFTKPSRLFFDISRLPIVFKLCVKRFMCRSW